MSSILIIEDEEKISRFVELELQHEGYGTGKAADGRSGLEAALTGSYDLVILEVLRRLRRESSVPVILLTARDSVTDKVTGLDMGANDYITKPFAIEELLARIRVILRNAEAQGAGNGAEEKEDPALLTSPCGIEMNTDSHAVHYKGRAVELTNREFILLRILMENRGVAMTRERLLSEAWGYDYYGETNIIDVYVRYIRQKTADDVIRTIRGVGYMME